MKDHDSPTTVYHQIIDQLVNETLHLGSGDRIARSGIFSNAADHQPFNSFIAALSQEQRDLLSQMLLAERHGAVHDVLAALSWWIDCRDVGLTVNGVPLPVDQSGMGLHGDFIGRCDDWEWPDASGEA